MKALTKAMGEADNDLKWNFKTPLHSSSKKYRQLTSYVHHKCKKLDISMSDSNLSLVSKFTPEDEALLFDDQPAIEQSTMQQTMNVTRSS